ncbi:M20 metallopeptidase family protein [Nocardia sp. KC 131]|uniref:M20 metallopeptidase family protein n=1 Tax=Nocardia arseniciresistens TaxID=3392119 RepID=UPI00398E948D
MNLDEMRVEIDRAARDLEADLIRHRHHLHRHPELSNREQNTAAYLANELRRYGADEVRTGIAGHGVIGVFHGRLSGDRTTALRADMDGLPVRETSGEDFASVEEAEGPDGTVVPVAHACGHDCHMATVLTAAKVLAQFREHLPGTFLCVFQPAEEGPPLGETGGAQAMIDAGGFDGIEPTMVFGMHVSPLPNGTVGYRAGSQFAAATRFEIVITGQQTHVALPWLGRDPLPAAAGIILGAGQLSRRIPAGHPAAVSVGHLEDRGRFNIIGDRVRLEGSIRCADDADMALLKQGLRELATAQAQGYGCTAEVAFDQQVPAVVNEPRWLDAAMATLRRTLDTDRLLPAPPTLGYDDVSALLQRFGGLYLLYGVQDTMNQQGAPVPLGRGRGMIPNHHPAFYANDDALLDSLRLHTHMVVDHLHGLIDP